MDGKLQPSVVNSQQPPVPFVRPTMQPMVVGSEVTAARSEFRGWFVGEAERTGAVGRGAIAALHNRLKAAARPGQRPLVTPQQLRKYYNGENYPRPNVLRDLCKQLKFNPPPAHFARML